MKMVTKQQTISGDQQPTDERRFGGATVRATGLVTAVRSHTHRIVLLFGICCVLVLIYTSSSTIDTTPIQHDAEWTTRDRKLTLISHSNKYPSNITKIIAVEEQFNKTFILSGHLMDETGSAEVIGSEVTSCLLHSFSPYIEREAAKRFLDPPRDQVYYANSPAIRWFKGDLVLVSRIWLDMEKYDEPNRSKPLNHFADNWLYTQKFDNHMRPTSNGSIIGIPAPNKSRLGDGPIEPRLVEVKGRLFITFNLAMAFPNNKYIDFTVMWDYEQNLAFIPIIKGGSPMINATQDKEMIRDKHWMAFVQNDELYFVQNLDPLSIMHCTLTGYCEFVHQEGDKFIFTRKMSHLRGGTPFELYEWPYYIGIAHTTLYKEHNYKRHYTSHLVVLCVEPYRIVYVSNDIQVHEDIFKLYPIVRYRFIDEGFLFPVGLILEGKNVMNIGVHVSDHSSVIIRVTGLQNLMGRIIRQDKRNSPSHGPPVLYLQQHIHNAVENETHTKFVHSL